MIFLSSSPPDQDEKKPVTESVKIYPRGRGKVLVITEKSIPRKPRRTRSPHFIFTRIKSNPSDFTIAEYFNEDMIKRIYMFPESRQLSKEERIKLLSGLLLTLVRQKSENLTKTKLSLNKLTSYVLTPKGNVRFDKILGDDAFTELSLQFRKDFRRYEKWSVKPK